MHFQSRFTHRVPWLFAAALLAFPGVAGAAPVRQPIQPLAAVGDVDRPVCGGPAAPFALADLARKTAERWTYAGYLRGDEAGLGTLGATIDDTDLQPVATICSPTFAGLPAPFRGSVATNPRRSRVGIGWRELGGALAEPAQLLPGDELDVPEVDDAAKLRLAVAPGPGQPTTVLELSDLAPGPSKVTISRDARGLVSTLTRADGTTTDAAGSVTTLPALAPRVSGTPSRWKVTANHLPGSAVVISRTTYNADPGPVVQAIAGRVTASLRTRRSKRSRERSADLILASTNRAAQVLNVQECRVGLSRRGSPTSITCKAYSARGLISDYADFYGVGAALKARRLEALVERIARNRDAATAPATARRKSRGRLAPSAAAGSAARQQTAAPVVARVTPQTAATKSLSPAGIKPLAADINGDGGIDYWTPRWNRYRSEPWRGYAAGIVLVSGPAGLSPHRVDLPLHSPSNSDISAIADITGDGIGELVVDLGERHGVIPGSAGWTGTSYPLAAPDPADLQGTERILRLQLSSPGAPFASLDDVTGDGRAEIAAADDGGASFSIASQAVLPGAVTELPSLARSATAPPALLGIAMTDESAPHVSPNTRVIGGQAIGLRWPVVATEKTPTGTVTITARDALGREVRAPITVQTPGNALLLDYDTASGEALLLGVEGACRTEADMIMLCKYTYLRVGPGSKVLQQASELSPLNTVAILSSARFLADGPDADARLEVAFSAGRDSVSVLSSTASGDVSDIRPQKTKIISVPKNMYDFGPLRLYPVIGAGGTRRLTVLAPTIKREPYTRRVRYIAIGSTTPIELAWK